MGATLQQYCQKSAEGGGEGPQLGPRFRTALTCSANACQPPKIGGNPPKASASLAGSSRSGARFDLSAVPRRIGTAFHGGTVVHALVLHLGALAARTTAGSLP